MKREITVSRALALSFDIVDDSNYVRAGVPAQSLADITAVRVDSVREIVAVMADNVCASSRNGCLLAARKGLQGRRQGRVKPPPGEAGRIWRNPDAAGALQSLEE